MLFNSFSFGFFLIITYLLYWLIFNRNIKIRNLFSRQLFLLRFLELETPAADYCCFHYRFPIWLSDSSRREEPATEALFGHFPHYQLGHFRVLQILQLLY